MFYLKNIVVCYRRVALQQFVSSDWLVQTWLAHVNVTVLGEGWEQGEQGLRVHVIIIIHVTKPPEEPQRRKHMQSKCKKLVVFIYSSGFLSSSSSLPVDVCSQSDERSEHLIFPFIGFILAQNESDCNSQTLENCLNCSRWCMTSTLISFFLLLKWKSFGLIIVLFVSVHSLCYAGLAFTHRKYILF